MSKEGEYTFHKSQSSGKCTHTKTKAAGSEIHIMSANNITSPIKKEQTLSDSEVFLGGDCHHTSTLP